MRSGLEQFVDMKSVTGPRHDVHMRMIPADPLDEFSGLFTVVYRHDQQFRFRDSGGVEQVGSGCVAVENLDAKGAQHLKLAREDLDSTVTYKEMLKFQLLRPQLERDDDFA